MAFEYAKEHSKKEVLEKLHPLVAKWFDSTFEDLTPPQRYGLIPIKEGRNVLISSPTGTGKTLTAFLMIINELLEMGERGELENTVYAVYVSPLRALNNDIHRNLEETIQGIYRLAEKKGITLPEIRHQVRTGDTPSNVKQKMLRKTPHILITTPETLAVILVAPKFREKLRTVRWVIIDEIHSLAENKRGVHLSLSLERLRELTHRDFVRIGLSATINPLEEVAKFLVGYDNNGNLRPCVIVDARYVKKKRIKVVSPVVDLIYTPSEVLSNKLYETIYEIVRGHRTTLIFTNTRSGTERVVFHLKKLARTRGDISEDQIMAHHGSLSRQVRHDVEERLKRGELKCIVSSTSLELGIDIGYIDVVVQIGSPKSVTRCLQRIGRSGHRLHETSKGIMICVDRDDLVEVAIMTREAYRGHLDRIRIPKNALDVLAQHIAGMAVEKKWSVDEAYRVVKRSYCYHNLSKSTFLKVLRYLAGKYSDLEHYKVYGKIWLDEEEGIFGRRGKYARVIYTLNVGTIPEEVKVKVYTDKGKYVGNIEEEFLSRLVPRDRFVLGGKVYEYISSRGFRATVRPAFDSKPTVPSWFSEMLPLSYDLALKIGEFRGKIFKWIKENRSVEKIAEYLKRECRTDENSAKAIINYFREQYQFLKTINAPSFPSHNVILVEYYHDGKRVWQIFHALYGRKTNDALSHALAYIASKKVRRNIGISLHDTGFALIYPPDTPTFVHLSEVKSTQIEEILKKSIKNTELMKRRFRHVANRGLMILKNYKGHEISLNKQQINATTLLKVVSKLPGFPLLEETYREILEDYMDIEHAKEVLRKIEKGKIREVELPPQTIPSPFAYNIVLVGLSDVVLMEDRRALIEQFHKMLLKHIKNLKNK